jgi:Enoyl-(Acyl carrier protein) reductase
MRRLATPEDIALAVLFFASPASGYVTGAVLEVDGGPDGPNSRDCRALACEENGDRLTDAEQVTTRRRASTSDKRPLARKAVSRINAPPSHRAPVRAVTCGRPRLPVARHATDCRALRPRTWSR